jgi:hypothetical protein
MVKDCNNLDYVIVAAAAGVIGDVGQGLQGAWKAHFAVADLGKLKQLGRVVSETEATYLAVVLVDVAGNVRLERLHIVARVKLHKVVVVDSCAKKILQLDWE